MVKYIAFSFLFALISLIIFQASSLSSEDDDDSYIFASADPLPLLSHRIKPNLTGSSCPYTVKIVTSCSSTKRPKDQVSLSFGDKRGNQVYVPKIDDPRSGTFEACSTDTFDISGPCTYDVCYVYLNRRGRDGIKIESVKISGKSTRTVTFNFKSWLPNNVWFGFNYCNGVSASPNL
ncbi:embryo-specific protein ATS3A-like isoform X1 [Silene latifolia]|uniref:embryo-specific protein ATS3A-like isoform X1 n=1 Tax=Silene latifolia TaxID=37657 RepID=UPI003D785A13